jgi:sugar (pentulose or hexulose) kinase
MNLIAFDLGASSGKTIHGAFDGKKLTVETVDRFLHSQIQIRDELFWDIFGIFGHLKDGIRKVTHSGVNVKSIGLDSFSNDFGLLDTDGRFVTQVHCYRDERTSRNSQKIYSMISKKKLHRLSGNQNALFGTLMQLASMCLEKQTYLLEGAGHLLFIPDLFNYFLTGEIASEYTISSVSQMFNFDLGDWSDEIIDVFAIPRRILPNIIQPGTRVGRVSRSMGLTNGDREMEVVAVCEHDTASAFLAAPNGNNSIIISSGTWSLVGVELDAHLINDFTYEHNIANEGGYPGHHRLLKNVMGLWIVQECQKSFGNNGTDYSIGKLIKLAKEARPLKFLINPNDGLFFSPGNMPQKIVSYCSGHGQGAPETPGEIVRCVFESLALHYRYVIEELEQAANKRFPQINIVGGGSQNDFLNQLTANSTGRRVIAGPSEATAMGNLITQLISFGELESVEEARQVIKDSSELAFYEPMDRDLWNEKYEEYLDVIRK